MTNEKAVYEILANGCQQLQLEAPLEPLVLYLNLLQKWNKAYNLTAIRDIEEMAKYHILDSLAIVPWVHGKQIIDVGSGPGLPGVPLALACPEKSFVLIDSNGKKTRFLQEVLRVLPLKNVVVVQERVERYHPTQGFDTVVSRAFSDLGQMAYWTEHLLESQGIWLGMKGRYPEEELSVLKYAYEVVQYKVPYIDGERCCIILKNAKTS